MGPVCSIMNRIRFISSGILQVRGAGRGLEVSVIFSYGYGGGWICCLELICCVGRGNQSLFLQCFFQVVSYGNLKMFAFLGYAHPYGAILHPACMYIVSLFDIADKLSVEEGGVFIYDYSCST
jgi:hypothetical protein